MPLFSSSKDVTTQLKKKNFPNEKALQTFVEENLEYLFGIRFIASEYSTSKQHGGRIDSLGLDENNSPVIIEYKRWEKDNIINQWLFYLDWLVDHEWDFQILVQNKLWNNIEVDFGSPRVLLVAQSFSKYDQYAINRMSENIELRSYARYEKDLFELKLTASSHAKKTAKQSKQLSKVKYTEYNVDQHLEGKNKLINWLYTTLQEKIFWLESEQAIEENPRKIYIAFRSSKNFLYIHIQAKAIKVHLPFKIEEFNDPKGILSVPAKWIQDRWVYCEAVLTSYDQIEDVVAIIKQSYLQSL